MSLNIRNLAARLFQRFTKKSTLKVQSPHRARLNLEAFEDRTVPTVLTPVIDVTSFGDVTEGGYGGLMFTRTVNTSGVLIVNYTIGGTSDNADHGLGTSGTVMFADGVGTSTFIFTATDDSDSEPTETLVLTLTSSTDYTIGTANVATMNLLDNDTPVALNDTVAAHGLSPVQIDVLANDVDPNGRALTVTGWTQPAAGTLTFDPNTNVFAYLPGSRLASANDSFTYTVSNGQGGTATAVATIQRVFWTAPTGGDWSNPANWNAGLLPTAEDDVTIALPATETITVPYGFSAPGQSHLNRLVIACWALICGKRVASSWVGSDHVCVVSFDTEAGHGSLPIARVG